LAADQLQEQRMRVAVRIALAIGSLIIVPVHAQQADPALQRLNNCVTTAARAPSSQQDIINGMNPAITEPDKVAWCFFLYVSTRAGNSDALFETWASDGETFNPNPQWPAARQPKQFRPNILLQVREAERVLGQGREGGVIQPFVLPPPRPLQPGSNVEETRRNRPAFDFIINNNLYKVTGLQAAFAKFAADRMLLSFPSDAIEVKANWFPVESPGDPSKSGIPGYTGTPNDADRSYHVATASDGKRYALVAMHVISKMVPNWTWATFEHQNNPGRCEFIGCRDAFGATQSFVPPDTAIPDPSDPSYNNPKNNPTPYRACAKTSALDALFAATAIDPVFRNYCLKGSQVDFMDASGMPIRLGNSITEETFDFQASCMSCHGRAAFAANGRATSVAGFDNVTGAPLGPLHGEWYWTTNIGGPWAPSALPSVGESVVPGAISADFVWSIPFCAIDDTKTPIPPSRCAAK
jgi:hypothetical protein